MNSQRVTVLDHTVTGFYFGAEDPNQNLRHAWADALPLSYAMAPASVCLFVCLFNTSQLQFPLRMLILLIALVDPSTAKTPIFQILKSPVP